MPRRQLKALLQQLLQPIAQILDRWGVRPNSLTIAGLLLSFAAATAIAASQLFLGGIVLLFAGLLDALDGALARMANKATPFGAFLDSVLDRYSEAAIYGGLFFWALREGRPEAVWLSFTALVGSFMVSYARARAEGLGLTAEVGLLGRAERLVVLVLGLLFHLLLPALWLLAVVTNFTALQRIFHVRSALSGR
ncbi:MAG: CDP-alcohol phosphatidyltransferase family protein [Chloroflexi bacterium]|nr:CDP-alcohol phosphatidyltransferase family protein [Chloroflexota bacterium]